MQPERAKRDVVRKSFQGGRTASVLQPPSDMRAHATESRTYDRPEWTMAELAIAAADVPPLAFSAACYSFAGDRTNYWFLWGALASEGLRMRERRGWSAQVRGEDGRDRFYLSELAQLVLDEDRYQHLFNQAPLLYWSCIGVTEKLWRHTVYERFDAIKYHFLSWLENARSMIEHRLRESAEDVR